MVEPKEKRGSFVYFFAQNHVRGSRAMRNLLGGKGANLAEVARLGIRVPPGFTITTQVCSYYAKHRSYPESFSSEITQNLERLERVTGKKFGDRHLWGAWRRDLLR